jgi:uncharacterized protein YbcI
VVTLHGALTPAEKALAQSPAGAAQVREYHRQLFTDACAPLRQEIEKITGSVVQVLTTGTMVQVFLLAQRVPADT